MIKLSKKKDGFASFVEVIIASIIFVLAAVGIFTTISMLQPQGTDSTSRLQAAYIAKQTLQELRSQIDARIWDNGSSLDVGTYTRTLPGYNVQWTVSNVPGLPLRNISMTVNYIGY